MFLTEFTKRYGTCDCDDACTHFGDHPPSSLPTFLHPPLSSPSAPPPRPSLQYGRDFGSDESGGEEVDLEKLELLEFTDKPAGGSSVTHEVPMGQSSCL